jgi:hypothetical protein
MPKTRGGEWRRGVSWGCSIGALLKNERLGKRLELFTGNTGGIGVEFNDERVKDLENYGQVVRLSLPEGHKRERLQG